MTDQTVILAAGLGSRLGSAVAGIPKPLMDVAGAPLIAHALAHAEASGCREAIVVIGHEGARVRAAVEAIQTPLFVRFVETPDRPPPTATRCWPPRRSRAPRFFLQMVDHVFAQPVLPLLDAATGTDGEAGRLLVDLEPDEELDLADATKVRLDGARITAIGKGIERLGRDRYRLLRPDRRRLRRAAPGARRPSHAPCRRRCARWCDRGAIFAVDDRRRSWADVDTPADRVAAERVLTMTPVRRA